MSGEDRKWPFDRWDPPLPAAADQLFIAAEDSRNNARLAQQSRKWAKYAMGYKDAADIVVGEFLAFRNDALVYPAVFLYRQYLELTLKNSISQAHRYLDVEDEFPKVHELDGLWRIYRGLLDEINLVGAAEAEFEQIGRLISEFCAVDPMSQAFRYPEDKKGNPSIVGIACIDLSNVRDVLQKISIMLEAADGLIECSMPTKAAR